MSPRGRHARPPRRTYGLWATFGSVLTFAYGFYAVDLLLQPDRWDRTPAYGILLDLAPPWAWGIAYAVAAFGMGSYVAEWRNRRWAIITHTYAIALTLAWLAVFVIRWVTDGATTAVNPINWSVLVIIWIWSAVFVDQAEPHVVVVSVDPPAIVHPDTVEAPTT